MVSHSPERHIFIVVLHWVAIPTENQNHAAIVKECSLFPRVPALHIRANIIYIIKRELNLSIEVSFLYPFEF